MSNLSIIEIEEDFFRVDQITVISIQPAEDDERWEMVVNTAAGSDFRYDEDTYDKAKKLQLAAVEKWLKALQ